MNQPTNEQIQWFWEQCGLEEEWEKWTGIKHFWWEDEEGDKISDSEEPPPIDLNNLFKYAVPKMEGVSLHYEDGFYGAEVLQNDTDYGYSGKDPAPALFWAIYKAFGGGE